MSKYRDESSTWFKAPKNEAKEPEEESETDDEGLDEKELGDLLADEQQHQRISEDDKRSIRIEIWNHSRNHATLRTFSTGNDSEDDEGLFETMEDPKKVSCQLENPQHES